MIHFIRSILALLILAAALPANAALKVLATTADWGALVDRARRRSRQRLHGDQRAAGRASRRCEAESGRARAHGGPPRRDRRGARNRLASGADAGIRQQPHSAGQSGLLRGRLATEAARKANALRSLARRHSSAGQSARAARSAQHRACREGAHRTTVHARSGATRSTTQQRGQGLRCALAGRDRALGERRPRRSRALRSSSCIATRCTCVTGWACRSSPRSSRSRACRRPRAISASW